jgi:hypothetical protein
MVPQGEWRRLKQHVFYCIVRGERGGLLVRVPSRGREPARGRAALTNRCKSRYHSLQPIWFAPLQACAGITHVVAPYKLCWAYFEDTIARVAISYTFSYMFDQATCYVPSSPALPPSPPLPPPAP